MHIRCYKPNHHQMSTENKWLYKFNTPKEIKLITKNNIFFLNIQLLETGILKIMVGSQLHIGQRIYNIVNISGNNNKTISVNYPQTGQLPTFSPEILHGTKFFRRIKIIQQLKHWCLQIKVTTKYY